MKNNDIEEMIDLIVVEKSKTPDFQGALDRLKSINLDYITSSFGYEQSRIISDYGIHDHPNLEMYGDIETLQLLLDRVNELGIDLFLNSKTSKEIFEDLGYGMYMTDDELEYIKNLGENTYSVTFNKDGSVSLYEYGKDTLNINLPLLKAIIQQYIESDYKL